jgi:hypothetical protein
MRKTITLAWVAATLWFGASAPTQACMDCDPAVIRQDGSNYTCVITTVNWDCEVCTVTPGDCGPFHPRVPSKL